MQQSSEKKKKRVKLRPNHKAKAYYKPLGRKQMKQFFQEKKKHHAAFTSIGLFLLLLKWVLHKKAFRR